MMKLGLLVLALASCHDSDRGFTVVGQPRWAISLGGAGNDRGTVAAFDSLGDVVVCGDVMGSTDSSGELDGAGGPGSFITKRVASDGAERWTKRLLSLGPQSAVGIGAMALTAQDEIVVTGSYYGSVDFGGQILSLSQADPPGHGDMFLAKYASDGQLLWVHGLSQYSNATATSLAVDAAGTIYAAAAFMRGTVELDDDVYRETDGDHDTILLAYDSDGSRRWFHVLQGATGPYPRSVALAANGDVLVAGWFGSPMSLGGAVLQPDARGRGFLARFRNDGLYLASQAVGPTAPYASWGPAIGVDASGLTVLQQVEVDETSGTTTSAGSTLRVLDDAGEQQWSTAIVNLGSTSPQDRTLLTTPDGLIASAAWTDNPRTWAGTMEIRTFDGAGSTTLSTFGTRLAMGTTATFTFGGAMASSGAIALTGQFAGSIDLGSGAMATRGQNDTDAFIVVVNPPRAGSR